MDRDQHRWGIIGKEIEREGGDALETGISVQNEHLPFDASNAVYASTSYFRFLVWWKIFSFFFLRGCSIDAQQVWCLESLNFNSKISRTNLLRKLNEIKLRIFEHSRKKKIAFLLSAFKKKGFKSCATIVTGGTSISSAPDLSAERMKHRRRRDGLGEGWGMKRLSRNLPGVTFMFLQSGGGAVAYKTN